MSTKPKKPYGLCPNCETSIGLVEMDKGICILCGFEWNPDDYDWFDEEKHLCPECGSEMENIGMFEDLWQCPIMKKR